MPKSRVFNLYRNSQLLDGGGNNGTLRKSLNFGKQTSKSACTRKSFKALTTKFLL